MTTLSVVRRPVVLEIGASASMLTSILANIASIRGRASSWGVTNDTTRAEQLAGQSIEADFREDYYRAGFVQGPSPEIMPGWSFARASAGTNTSASHLLETFGLQEPRTTNRGLLSEADGVNFVGYSGADPGWVSGGASPTTIDTSVVIDGEEYVELLLPTGVSGFSNTFSNGTAFALAGPNAYRASARVRLSRPLVSGEVVQVVITGSTQLSTIAITSTDGDRINIEMPVISVVAAETVSFYVFVVSPLASPLTMHIGRRQVESGQTIASLVQTSGATAYRDKDEAAIDVTSASAGGVFMQARFKTEALNSKGLFHWRGPGSSFVYVVSMGDQVSIEVRQDGSLIAAGVKALDNGDVLTRVFVGWDGAAARIVVNGTVVATGPMTGSPGLVELAVGRTWFNEALRGNVERLIVFNTALTSAEQLAITTAG